MMHDLSTRFSPGLRVGVRISERFCSGKDYIASDSQTRTIAFFNRGIGRYRVGVLAKAESSESSKPTGADAAWLARGMGEPEARQGPDSARSDSKDKQCCLRLTDDGKTVAPILNKAMALTAEKYPLDDCPRNGTMSPAEKLNVDRNNRPHLSTTLSRSMRVAGCLHLENRDEPLANQRNFDPGKIKFWQGPCHRPATFCHCPATVCQNLP